MIVLCTNKVSFLPVVGILYHSLSRQVCVLVASRLTLLGSEDPFPVKDTRLLEKSRYHPDSVSCSISHLLGVVAVGSGLSAASTASLGPLIQSHMVRVRAVPMKTF